MTTETPAGCTAHSQTHLAVARAGRRGPGAARLERTRRAGMGRDARCRSRRRFPTRTVTTMSLEAGREIEKSGLVGPKLDLAKADQAALEPVVQGCARSDRPGPKGTRASRFRFPWSTK